MRRLFQFETRKQPVASRNVFVNRLTRNAISSAAIVAVSLVVGTCGYVYFENMRTVDAFANASMTYSLG